MPTLCPCLAAHDTHHSYRPPTARPDPCYRLRRPAGRNKLKLSFKVPYRTAFGQSLRVVGSDEYLGNWVPTQGRAMGWNPNDEWTVEFECVAG